MGTASEIYLDVIIEKYDLPYENQFHNSSSQVRSGHVLWAVKLSPLSDDYDEPFFTVFWRDIHITRHWLNVESVLRYDFTYAWCVKCDAWSVFTEIIENRKSDSTCTSCVMRICFGLAYLPLWERSPRLKLRLHKRVMREAWCVIHIADSPCTSNVKRDASKFILLKEPPSADLLWHFYTHGHGTIFI